MPGLQRPLPAQPAMVPASLPGADRPMAGPLAGVSVLVVDDSRAACEGLRLSFRHLGARLRRADSLAAARAVVTRHPPDVAIVDLGLPDGPGDALIAELAARIPRPRVIMAMSGLTGGKAAARAAGADLFVEKPLPGPRALGDLLLPHLSGHPPPGQGPVRRGWRSVAAILAGGDRGDGDGRQGRAAPSTAPPDPQALADDLHLALGLLTAGQGGALPGPATAPAYVVAFLAGIGRMTGDAALVVAARQAAGDAGAVPALRQLVQARIAGLPDAFGRG